MINFIQDVSTRLDLTCLAMDDSARSASSPSPTMDTLSYMPHNSSTVQQRVLCPNSRSTIHLSLLQLLFKSDFGVHAGSLQTLVSCISYLSFPLVRPHPHPRPVNSSFVRSHTIGETLNPTTVPGASRSHWGLLFDWSA